MAGTIVNGAPKTNGVSKSLVNGLKKSHAAKHNLPAHFIGGNHLDAAASSKVKDFVAQHDGHTVITSVCSPNSGKMLGSQTSLTRCDRC